MDFKTPIQHRNSEQKCLEFIQSLRSIVESCEKAQRLLDIYAGALDAFHGAQLPFARGMRSEDPEFRNALGIKHEARAALLHARRNYCNHVTEHKCRAAGTDDGFLSIGDPYAA